MGAKQTKIEGTYLPETPIVPSGSTCVPIAMQNDFEYEEITDVRDPRSPNICRTPINIFSTKSQSTGGLQNMEVNRDAESAVGQLRKRFFKGFSYNLNDPRSPGYQFNRTPLSFDDSQDKILNLDDTFADLFAGTQPQPITTTTTENPLLKADEELLAVNNVDDLNSVVSEKEFRNAIDKMSNSIDFVSKNTTYEVETNVEAIEEVTVCSESYKENSLVEKNNVPLPKPASLLQRTPKILQDEIDPRSPTIGVDRTPIIFNDDDDETSESVLLESILATLSLDMSDLSTSICSTSSNNQKTAGESNKTDRQGQLFRKITHKRMRRTRANEKIPLPTRRITKELQMSPHRVVCENSENASTNMKSLKLKQKDTRENVIKRTPLSCIKNSNEFHSRITEKSKIVKSRLEYTNDESISSTIHIDTLTSSN
ncbi:uncharacterized protein LOC105214223 [Zeugodacus cucurbitae]|uniref:Mitochondrial transcription factor 1 n=1 Tax=Zeugodacus cucurbitae TaxID=28588 RepID=A0A0A1XDG0_ZEUCU|nr:uncharacterized protein LOC105214223 [Zeugodacus cucurbitae]